MKNFAESFFLKSKLMDVCISTLQPIAAQTQTKKCITLCPHKGGGGDWGGLLSF